MHLLNYTVKKDASWCNLNDDVIPFPMMTSLCDKELIMLDLV